MQFLRNFKIIRADFLRIFRYNLKKTGREEPLPFMKIERRQ